MNKENYKRILNSKLLFYFSYTLLLFKITCEQLDIVENIKNYLTITEILLLVFCIIIQSRKYNIKTIIIICNLLISTLYSYTVTKNSNIFILVLLIIASKNIDIKKFIKYDIKIKILFLILNMFLIYAGIMENAIFFREEGNARYSLGFSSPNTLGAMILSICLELTYINNNMKKIYTYLLILLVIIIITCNSRSAEIGIILLMILLPIYKKKIRLKKIIPYTVIIFTILSFFTVYLYGKGSKFALILDDLLSTRLMCSYNFLNIYDIKLFGNYFEEVDVWMGYVNSLDNGYIYFILNQGIIIYVIITILNIILMKNLIKNNENIIVAILLVLYSYGLMERGVFFITYNVFLLYINEIIFKYEKIKTNKSDEKIIKNQI